MNIYYNMVGVAVAMVISTMHEKSCIDSHNAQKFEKKIQNSVIHTSRNHNDELSIIRKVMYCKIEPEFLIEWSLI